MERVSLGRTSWFGALSGSCELVDMLLFFFFFSFQFLFSPCNPFLLCRPFDEVQCSNKGKGTIH